LKRLRPRPKIVADTSTVVRLSGHSSRESLEVGAANSLGAALVRVQMGPNEKTDGVYMRAESETRKIVDDE
jgi:hypothetical protein